jgi:ion channel-forming bestrophin family protein
MFVDFKGSVLGLLRWQWKSASLFLASATLVVVADFAWHVDLDPVRLPALPLAVVGGAIGIFASFRTNSAYDRWWEGRKLWGRLVNTSRHFCTQVLGYLPAQADGPSETQRRLVRRQIAYVHVLRCLLRAQDPFEDRDVTAVIDAADQPQLRGESNLTHALLQQHADELIALTDAGTLTELRMQSFDESIRALLDIQGGCERIKKTPFPRGYGFVLERLIQAYGLLLPLGLVDSLDWMTIPITLLVCMAFAMISEIGRVLEDPFTMFWPALPLSALSKTIEINLRQRLGETNLPAMPAPNEQGVLM